MLKLKKAFSVLAFIIAMFLYSLLVMVFLAKINFNNWILEFVSYFILGIIWVFPAIYILKPFKKNDFKEK